MGLERSLPCERLRLSTWPPTRGHEFHSSFCLKLGLGGRLSLGGNHRRVVKHKDRRLFPHLNWRSWTAINTALSSSQLVWWPVLCRIPLHMVPLNATMSTLEKKPHSVTDISRMHYFWIKCETIKSRASCSTWFDLIASLQRHRLYSTPLGLLSLCNLLRKYREGRKVALDTCKGSYLCVRALSVLDVSGCGTGVGPLEAALSSVCSCTSCAMEHLESFGSPLNFDLLEVSTA